ncbi:YbaB/EbfC family nucleoid-associated protein [Penaeicola halotolerans]|uniref:YbaB/EbfC family nucleoid-associated protein n=1 Tax=Penaeicola halotolerans TaxID=2793196 RepID=UPI001CF8B8C3|nr:YbaB/EbfC family nucleoid-associated protein [Penaeicola halotolerans]
MFDFMNIMSKVKEVQAKVKEAQEKLAHIQITAESGAGMVKATINGKREIISIDIDNSLVKVEDKDMLQDLVAAAVNNANRQIDERIKEEMKKATEGSLPNIPGMDFGNMFGG